MSENDGENQAVINTFHEILCNFAIQNSMQNKI